MNHGIKKGVLTMQYAAGDFEYWFKIGEDEYIEVTFPLGVEQALEVPPNVNVALCMDDNNAVCTHSEFYKVLDYV